MGRKAREGFTLSFLNCTDCSVLLLPACCAVHFWAPALLLGESSVQSSIQHAGLSSDRACVIPTKLAVYRASPVCSLVLI